MMTIQKIAIMAMAGGGIAAALGAAGLMLGIRSDTGAHAPIIRILGIGVALVVMGAILYLST